MKYRNTNPALTSMFAIDLDGNGMYQDGGNYKVIGPLYEN